MLERPVFQVVPAEDGVWKVLRDGRSRPHFESPDKMSAIRVAKRLAKTHRCAEVLIRNQDGIVETKQFYAQETRNI